jgi:ribose/xylose/arabinose/galactoside ABC-type transport system permease subunit
MADAPIEYASPLTPPLPWNRREWVRTALRLAPLLVAIALLLAVFQLKVEGGGFLRPRNLIGIMDQVAINTILGLGITLTILIGGIDLSVGAVLALSGTVAATVLAYGDPQQQSVLGLVAAVAAAMTVAVAVGAVNGVCAAKTRMPPFIITLGTMLIARGIAKRFNEARPIRIDDAEAAFLWLGTGRLFDRIPVPVVLMLLVFAVSAVLLHRTRFGQHVYAIGGSREAARFTGIPLAKVEVSVYLISSAFAGLAGIIYASQLYTADPAGGGGYELDAIAAAVIGGVSFTGGVGTMVGTLLGAIVIGILNKGLNQAGVHFSYQDMIKGLVILAAVFIDVRGRK